LGFVCRDPGPEIGLYDDPYSRSGYLQFQAWRAARLVVDTGNHALGWPRQEDIDFMAERTGMDHDQRSQRGEGALPRGASLT
jgi:uncharacterized protein (DUF885 family)